MKLPVLHRGIIGLCMKQSNAMADMLEEQHKTESESPDASEQKSPSENPLGTEPLGRLLVRLGIPAFIAQLASMMYSIVDRILLGHIPDIGADVLAGMGICVPIVTGISAFAMFAACGGAPLASMALGAKDHGKARHFMLNVQTLLMAFAVVLMLVCYLFMEPLLMLFGASEATIGYAMEYLSIYLVGTVFFMLGHGVGQFLLAQGKAKEFLVASVVTSIVHIILAVIFVFGLGWGIGGAAAASVLSQLLEAAFVVYYLRKPDCQLKFEFALAWPDWPVIGRILSVGSGRFFIMATESFLLIVVNSTAAVYGGDLYVGAIAIMYSIQSLAFTPVFGFTQGVQPVISYNYGAKKLARTRRATKMFITSSFVINFVMIGLVMLFPDPWVRMFTDDADLVALAVGYAQIYYVGMLVFGLQLSMQSVFMGLGKGLCSLSVAAVRKVVFFIPLVLILPHFCGIDGVFIAEPISDFMSVAYCSLLFFLVIPKMLRDLE